MYSPVADAARLSNEQCAHMREAIKQVNRQSENLEPVNHRSTLIKRRRSFDAKPK